jgi:hypothetical protein
MAILLSPRTASDWPCTLPASIDATNMANDAANRVDVANAPAVPEPAKDEVAPRRKILKLRPGDRERYNARQREYMRKRRAKV